MRGDDTATAGQPYQITVSVTGDGADEITSWTINWGDGTVDTRQGRPGPIGHTYAVVGMTHDITVSVTDDDGTWTDADLVVPAYDAIDQVRRYAADTGTAVADLGPPGSIDTAFATVVGPDGLLYVTANSSDSVERYDLDDNRHVDTFVKGGSGGLDAPRGLAFGPDGNLYVASSNTGEILRFDPVTGSFVDDFVPAGTLTAPAALSFGPDGRLYVADHADDDIERFAGSTGDHVDTFTTLDPGSSPAALAWGPNGNVFVALSGLGRVDEIDHSTGEVLGTLSDSKLRAPAGLQFGPDGALWVADYWTNEIKRFDSSDGAQLDRPIGADEVPLGPRLFTFVPDKQVAVTAAPPKPEANKLTADEWLAAGDGRGRPTELSFEPNGGRAEERLDYIARGASYDAVLSNGDVILAVGDDIDHTVSMELVNRVSDPDVRRSTGGPGKPGAASVRYDDVYEGIDVHYTADGGNLEYSFVIEPGADPSDITLAFDGIEDMRVDPDGSLYLDAATGADLRSSAPVTYQQVLGETLPVESDYRLRRDGSVGFRVGDHDPNLPLIIDPTFRSAASSSSGGTGTVTVSKPAGVAQNDVMLASIAQPNTGTVTAPTGWMLIRRDAGTGISQDLYSKVATASEPATYVWTLGTAAQSAGAIVAYRGVDVTTPIGAHGGQVNAASTSYTAPTITSTVTGETLVAFFANTAGGLTTPPTGMVELADQASTSGSTEIAAELRGAAGPTGPRTATGSSSVSIGQLVTLRPSGTPRYIDLFDGIAYTGSNGTIAWAPNPWTEVGDDGSASTGDIFVETHVQNPTANMPALKVKPGAPGKYVYRQVDISGTGPATLSYTFHNELATTGVVELQISPNGGVGWTTLRTYSVADAFGTEFIDISAYRAANTQIRFIVAAAGTRHFRVDDVQINVASANPTFVVNSTAIAGDASPGNGVCSTGGVNSQGAPACTLRAAIEEANALGGADTINFGLPTTETGHSGGIWTISPNPQLPLISTEMVIDATTQPGYVSSPVVRLDGLAAAGGTGFRLSGTADLSRISGFMITRFPVDGVHIATAGDTTTISRNWIGSNNSGSSTMGNSDDGIDLNGADALIDSNVVNHSADEGIDVRATGATITGNHVGLEADGSSGAGNTDVGIAVFAANTTIGGTTAAARNVISRNWEGIEINSSNNTIRGNYIGTDATGTLNRGNRIGDGIEIQSGTSNRVGGTAAGAGNRIAFNQLKGVDVTGGNSNSVLGNSIFANGGLGIDLGTTGVTANDPGDVDAGANDLLNRPVLTNVGVAGPSVNASFTIDVPAGTYRVEFFSNPGGADPSGSGEGETWVHAASVVHPGGSASYAASFGGAAGDVITATTTRDLGAGAHGPTSEFSVAATAGVVTVNSTGNAADATPGNGTCATGGTNSAGAPACTLRAAIQEANTPSGIALIRFAMPATEPGHSAGVWTISPTSELPTINHAVALDATTQPGWTSKPVVELNGAGAGAGSDGFRILSPNVEIRGFAVNRFLGDGIEINTTSTGGAVIAGNHIGLDASGLIDRGNNWRGIDIQSGSGPSTIGGPNPGDRNVISGNGADGILIWNSNDNVILDNFVGTDVSGNASGPGIGNGADGIAMGSASSGNLIGQAGAGNVLSGNANDGFENDATGSGNVVRGNTIGLGANGSTVVANGRHGIVLYNGATGTQIGGSGAGQGNTISGNVAQGVHVNGNGNPATAANVISGNHIGTDRTGTLARGNGSDGVFVFGGAVATEIGGATAAHGNVISGNGGGGGAGVYVEGVSTSGTIVRHNRIGTNAAGDTAMANNPHGVRIDDATGTDVWDNLISGNTVHGVYIHGPAATGTEVLRNTIGTDAGVTVPVPNGFDGVRLEAGSSGSVIGSPGNGNVIAGNAHHGVNLNSSSANTVQANGIGTDVTTPTIDLGNGWSGVYGDVFGSSSNSIGGTGLGAANTIAYNRDGVRLDSGVDNTILGNRIHHNDLLGIDLAGDGVSMNDPGDGDAGANDLLNHPIITSAVAAGPTATVAYDLDAPAGDYRIEFSVNPSGADPSGWGEGESITHVHAISGHPGGSVSYATAFAGTAGTVLTATATEDLGGATYGATSEYSPAVTAVASTLAIVNATGDAPDASVGDGGCHTGALNSQGQPECTLRAAIQEANSASAVTTVHFAIPTTEPGYSASPLAFTLTPASPYDLIVQPVTIDASTQPGWGGDPVVQLDGSGAVGASGGLVLRANDSIIRGFIVHSFPDEGLEVDGSTGFGDDNVLTNNWIGFDAALAPRPNADMGVLLTVGASGNVLGGTGPDDANVVGFGAGAGVVIRNAGSDGNVLVGNIIGRGPDGTTPMPNTTHGVMLHDMASSNRIGGAAPGEANLIAGNGGDGVRLAADAGSGNTILGNQLVANGGLGIDLGGDGPTDNDGGDPDTGPNDLLNRPVLTDARIQWGRTTVAVVLDLPAGVYRLEVFDNAAADPSGQGEGETLLRALTVTHAGTGPAPYTVLVDPTATVVTATVTKDLGGGAYGSTSELSNALAATPAFELIDASQRRSDSVGTGLDGSDMVVGVAGAALALDGTTERVGRPALDLTDQSLTLSAWVRPSTLTGAPRVLSKRDGAGAAVYELWIDAGTGEAVVTLQLAGSPVSARGGAVTTSGWHHLTGTWNGTDLVMFVDGVEVDRVAATGALATAAGTVVVIGDVAGGGSGFDGDVDHVVVASAAFDPGRVAADHTGGTTPGALVHVGAQQTAPAGAWTVSSAQARSGGFALAAPQTSSGSPAWAVATGIDEPGLVFESWWWITTDAGIDVAAGTRAGVVPTDQFEAALVSPAGWELRHRTGATQATDAPAAGTPATGRWVKVELWTDQLGVSRLLVDDVEVTGWTAQGPTPARGSAALRAGLLPPGQSWYVDDPRGRKLITPEPVTSLGGLDRN